MTITEYDTHFEIKFPYRKHIIEDIKTTFDYKSRSYDPVGMKWKVDKNQKEKIERFGRKHNFYFDRPVPKPQVDHTKIPSPPQLNVNPRDYLNVDLYPYQKEDVAAILRWKNVMNGNDMGLGKSAESIAAVTIANAFPCLVVCPTSLKYNWQDEWMKFASIKSIVLSNSVKRTWQNYYNIMRIPVFITNYESLQKYFVRRIPTGEKFMISDIEFFDTIRIFKSIIIDEAHYIKNPNAIRTKITTAVSYFMEYKILMSGTFIVNKPKDLVSPLRITGHLKKTFGGETRFLENYCRKDTSAEELAELNYKLRTTCFFHRLKKDHLKDLPDKTRQVVHCDITNRKEYDKAEKNFISYLKENLELSDQELDAKLRGQVMVQIGILKRLAAKGKIQDSVEYIRNVNESGQKILVFTWHKDIAKEIQTNFPSFKIIDGDVDPQVRHHYVTSFQNDSGNLGIISTISTGGVGYNMTASSIVLFIEQGWSPKDQDQAEDRAFRNGQKNAVFCPYMIGRDTIDEHIYNIIDSKRKIVNAAFGINSEVQTDIVNDIINIYKKQ